MQLPPVLTLAQAAALLRALPADGGARIIDASALREFDSAALALLLQARRRGMQVQGAPAKLVQLARLYGVDQLLGVA